MYLATSFNCVFIYIYLVINNASLYMCMTFCSSLPTNWVKEVRIQAYFNHNIPFHWLKFKPVIFYSVVSSILSHILRNTDLYSLLYIYVFHIFSIYVLSLYMYVQVLIQLVNESPPQKEDVKAWMWILAFCYIIPKYWLFSVWSNRMRSRSRMKPRF